MPRRWMLLVTLLAVLGFFALAATRLGIAMVPVDLDKPAPEFALPDLDGEIVRLSDYRGKVVLVNFWATWCPPCKEEMPALQQLHEEMGDRVEILGLDRAEPAETVRRFVRKYGITFKVLLDREDEVARRYQLTGIPETFFVDSEGVVRVKWIGPMTLAQMRGFVEQTAAATGDPATGGGGA